MGQNGSTHKISAQDKAILDMKNQRDKLHQYQKKITLLTDRETNVARDLIARGDKPRALLALRRKKYQETLLAKTDAQLEQLEKLTSSVEFALVQRDVVFGLEQGTRVLGEINREMGGIENVERLMGENEDAVAYQKEITEMLGGRMSNQDEDEVEDELDALTAEITRPFKTTLPDVPSQRIPEPVAGQDREDAALRDGDALASAGARARARANAGKRAKEPITDDAAARSEEPMLA